MTSAFDAVVIGAGIIGAAVADALSGRGQRVVVVEAAAAPATGSTGASLAGVRGQWDDEVNARISWNSIQRYRDAREWIGQDVGYRPSGYLLIVPPDAWDDHLEAVALQRNLGIPVEVLTPSEAQRHTPFDTAGVAGCTWGTADGVVDAHLATGALLGRARERGTQLLLSTPVTAIETAGGDYRVYSDDRCFTAPVVVNAAGSWARDVAAFVGLEVPVDAVRRVVYSSAPDDRLAGIPMTIDVLTGVFLRSDGPRLLFGRADPEEPVSHRTDVPWEWLEPTLEAGCGRFPWLAEVPIDNRACWGGTYEVTADHRPFVGRMPGAPGWINACGFSGHGVMQAPVIGELVAEEVVDGRAHSIDLAPLRIERLASLDRALRLVF